MELVIVYGNLKCDGVLRSGFSQSGMSNSIVKPWIHNLQNYDNNLNNGFEVQVSELEHPYKIGIDFTTKIILNMWWNSNPMTIILQNLRFLKT